MKVGKEQRAGGETAGSWASAHRAVQSDGTGCFSRAHRTTDSGHLLQQGKFPLDIQKKSFAGRVVQAWDMNRSGDGISILVGLQNPSGQALSSQRAFEVSRALGWTVPSLEEQDLAGEWTRESLRELQEAQMWQSGLKTG